MRNVLNWSHGLPVMSQQTNEYLTPCDYKGGKITRDVDNVIVGGLWNSGTLVNPWDS